MLTVLIQWIKILFLKSDTKGHLLLKNSFNFFFFKFAFEVIWSHLEIVTTILE